MNDLNAKRTVYLIAFIGVMLIATALLLYNIFGWVKISSDIAYVTLRIGEAVSIVVTCLAAFFFVRTKRKPVWYVLYAIAVTIIAILFILSFPGVIAL